MHDMPHDSMCNCPMGSMGPAMMIGMAVLFAAVIATLIALTIFLVRRSRHPPATGR